MNLQNYKSNRYYIVLCLLLSLIYCLIYWKHLTKDPVLDRDDILLIIPLKAVNGLPHYIESVKSNFILDFQPVRDLTFLANIKLEALTGISTYHLANLALFIISVFLLMKLLEALEFSAFHIFSTAVIYSVHPIMVSSIGWISARKHSLALVFLLLSMIELIKNKKITKKIIVFYLLSILSHQIFILYPIWVIVYLKFKKLKIAWVNLLVLGLLGLGVLFVGVLKTFYLDMGNVTYRYFHWTENISRYVLSVGRSVSQIFFPISISTEYFQGSWLNLLGIPVLIISVYLTYKSRNKKDPFLWIFLAILSHILTYITFINDTYLYLPLICVLIVSNYYVRDNFGYINRKYKIAITMFASLLLMFKTVGAAHMWESNLKLWQYSYDNEESPHTSILLGSCLLESNEKRALELILWGVSNYDLNTNKSIFLFFINTILQSHLPIQMKIEILADNYKDHEIYKGYYAMALLNGNIEQVDKGIQILKKLFKDVEVLNVKGSHGVKIIKSIQQICENIESKERICKELGISYIKKN